MGHTGEGKARGKAGLLTASTSLATSLSPALATKDGATVKDGVRVPEESILTQDLSRSQVYTSNTHSREFMPRLQSRVPALSQSSLNTPPHPHNAGLGRPSRGSQRTPVQQISDPHVPVHFPYTAQATSVGDGSVGQSEVRRRSTLHLGSRLPRTMASC